MAPITVFTANTRQVSLSEQVKMGFSRQFRATHFFYPLVKQKVVCWAHETGGGQAVTVASDGNNFYPNTDVTTPSSASIESQTKSLNSRICNAILIALSILGLPGLLASLSRAVSFGVTPVMIMQALLLLFMIIVTLLRHRISYELRLVALLSSLYVLAVLGLWSFGHLGGGKLMLLVFIVVTGMLTGSKIALGAVGLSSVTIAIFGWLYVSGIPSGIAQEVSYQQSAQTWITATVTMIFLGGFISKGLSTIFQHQRTLMSDLLTEASYRTALIDQSSATILVLDHSMKLKDWNQGSLPMFATQVQPEAGIPIRDALESGPGADKLLAAMKAGLAGKTTSEYEMQLNIRGSYRSYVWNLTPYQDDKQRLAGLICIGQDVTSSRQAQQEAAHSTRLAAMGEMTTSIAHEINQPLAIIRLASGALLRRVRKHLESGESLDTLWVNEKAERIDTQVNRAATITDHMRLFGSDIGGVTTELDLLAVCEDLEKLRAESMKLQGIDFNYRIDSGEFKVLAQKEELEQVLINILDNAQKSLSSIPPEKQKTVTITAHKDDGGTTISVSDSGMGIDESVINNIFDPFFTTREVGEGAGLGLSVARKLLNDMGATIKATNLEDGGACFLIHFPSGPESTAN